ncbi:MAG: hypothetical protein JWM41_179 [Gemmatimonadetes bacterium]|nr:hypothetical protein [Gemmatimonadota bacterium]
MRFARTTRLWLATMLLSGAPVALAIPSTAHAQVDTARARVRLRVIGVFDEETGNPLEGADVSDALTGITSRTTTTGTVAVFLGDTTGTLLRIKKVGYQASTVLLGTALRDTSPVTVTMLHAGHALAPVITVGERSVRLAPSDTISTLLRNGFYERREAGGAPRFAFVTGDRLRGSSVVTNARFYGRGICESNVYIDGMHFVVPTRTGHFQKEGIDAFVSPFDVAGIETYELGDAPAATLHTGEGAGALGAGAGFAANSAANAAGTLASAGCVSMIWLTK